MDKLDGTYQNPVGGITRIGDPFVLRASDGRYYMYATSGYRAWSSTDLVAWTDEGIVKTSEPWGVSNFWAPEVVEFAGRFYMYYTAKHPELGLRLGVAVSDGPVGPFNDPYDHPLFDFGYSAIDANVLLDDDGRKYLYFSRDCSTNIINERHESHLYGVPLGDDLISVVGEPTLLTRPDQPWELKSGPEWLWNEGPTVLKRDALYYLMYSANFYGSRHYSVGYATSRHPLGPYTKYLHNPVMTADPWYPDASEGESLWRGAVSGAGHHSVTRSPDGSEWWIVYHTHTDPQKGGGNRQPNIDRMGFRADGSIYVNGPTLTPQPLPSGAAGLANVAPEAIIEVSGTAPGCDPQALVDGEIALDAHRGGGDWVSAGSEAWVRLRWAAPQSVQSVFVYDSAQADRRLKSGRVRFSDGTTAAISFQSQPGAAAIAEGPSAAIEWLEFVASETMADGGTPALSEIVVLATRGPR